MEFKSLEKLDRPEAEVLFQQAFVEEQGLLDLENKNIGLEELKLLAEWESFPKVEKLYLSNNQLGDLEIEALENLQSNVRSLYLNHNMLGDGAAGRKDICRVETFPKPGGTVSRLQSDRRRGHSGTGTIG
jgi:hypothetical protein